MQETLSNQPTFYQNNNSSSDFLANTTEDYSNNNGSNLGFLNNRHLSNVSSNGLHVDGSLNLSTPELNIPVLPSSGGAISGIPNAHPHQILGTTPLSQIGCPPLNLEQYSAQLSPSCGDSEDEIDSELDSNADEMGSNYSLHSKRQKRGILPKHATSVMRAWLFQHLVVNQINHLSTFFTYFPSLSFTFTVFSIHTRPRMKSEPLPLKQI